MSLRAFGAVHDYGLCPFGAPLIVGASGVLAVGGYGIVLFVGVVGLFLLAVVFVFQPLRLCIDLVGELFDCLPSVCVGYREGTLCSVEEGAESAN